MHEEGCIALEDQVIQLLIYLCFVDLNSIENLLILDYFFKVAQSCLLEKGTKLHVIIGNPPSNYHEDLFSQFKAECKNQMLLVSGYLHLWLLRPSC